MAALAKFTLGPRKCKLDRNRVGSGTSVIERLFRLRRGLTATLGCHIVALYKTILGVGIAMQSQ
jgi:hypothetical protein